MALNRKLTPILSGRIIQAIRREETLLWIDFADGSQMKVKISVPASSEAPTSSEALASSEAPASSEVLATSVAPTKAESFETRSVKRVRQTGPAMTIDFEDGSSLEIALAEATSSVMLRDKDRVLEYAD